MKKNTNEAKRKSAFNESRDCYLSVDGKTYCYRYWDSEKHRMVTQEIEVGKDLSVDLTIFLDESDHETDLDDRYQDELRDTLFDLKVDKFDSNNNEDGSISPWEKIAADGGSVEDVLFAEPQPENPQIAQVRRVIEEKCTQAQQDFFFDHYGQNMQLEEMRRREVAQTGKPLSHSAMNNRNNKIVEKVAKFLGVERIKRHKYPTKKKD